MRAEGGFNGGYYSTEWCGLLVLGLKGWVKEIVRIVKFLKLQWSSY